MPEDWMVIGTLVAPFGVRGEAKVDLHTDFPDRFTRLETVYLGKDHTPFQLERSRPHKLQMVVKLRGVDSPGAVEALRGQELFVPRSEAHVLPEGHYYLDEIIGVMVEASDGRKLGTITDVLRTGSNDVFVVNEGRNAVLIPVIRDAVLDLDLRARRLVVDPWVLNIEE